MRDSIHLKRVVAAVLVAAIALLAGCSRDPDVTKRRYLESGNRYFAKGKYKEARIMYLDALQKDKRFGEAYYRLGLTALKTGPLMDAVNALRRAVELLPKDSTERREAMVTLADVYVMAAREQKSVLDEVESFCHELLSRDPNSFDGHRLTGDLHMARSAIAFSSSNKEEGQKLLTLALEEYTKANSVKPDSDGVLLQMARANASLGHQDAAEQIYKQLTQRTKTLQVAYSELYRLYVFQRKFAEGEQVLKTAFQNNPKQFGFLTSLALHYSLSGRREDMVTTLNQIKSHASEYDQAYVVVGDFYLRTGDGDSAIREYKEGMTKNPKMKVTYQKRIIETYMRQGRRAEAADLNAQLLKDDPKDNEAKGLAATFLLDKGEIARAITELNAVVTRSPENPVAHYQLGRAHAARGEYEQARQQFSKAIELRPDYVMARLAMAQLQVTRGDFDAALKTSWEIMKIDPNSVNARLIESAALMGQRKFGETRQALNNLLKAYPDSPDVQFQLGLVNLAESKFSDATEAFKKTYKINPANPRGLMGMVETELAQNHTDQAIALLKSESERNPNSLELKAAIGNVAGRAGRFDEALQSYNSILNSLDKNSRSRGDILLRIGEIYRRKGDDAGAVATLTKAREVLPDNVAVLGTLALSLEHAGKWMEAKQLYEATLKIDANSGVYLNNLAFLMAEHNGDLDDALTKAQKAKSLLPNTFEVADTLGWIYLKKNLSDEAIRIFSELVDKAPKHSTFRYHLGMALYQKGDKPKAIKELQQSLQLSPQKDEKEKIQQMLSRLTGA